MISGNILDSSALAAYATGGLTIISWVAIARDLGLTVKECCAEAMEAVDPASRLLRQGLQLL